MGRKHAPAPHLVTTNHTRRWDGTRASTADRQPSLALVWIPSRRYSLSSPHNPFVYVRFVLEPSSFILIPFYLLIIGIEVYCFTWSYSVGLLWTSDRPVAETSYLTTHNTLNRETSMPPVRFESAIPASKQPQTNTLYHMATGVSTHLIIVLWKSELNFVS